jgi:hypothetical protein
MRKSDRQKRKRFILVMFVAAALLLYIDLRIEGGLTLNAAAAVAKSLIPNLIAAIVVGLCVYFFVRETDRNKYLKLLAPIRRLLREHRDSERLTPEAIQELMKRIVAAMSNLYFEAERPDVPRAEQEIEKKDEPCNTCGTKCDIQNGACIRCHDLLASWKEGQPAILKSPAERRSP